MDETLVAAEVQVDVSPRADDADVHAALMSPDVDWISSRFMK